MQALKNDALIYSFKVNGLERKQLAQVLADVVSEQVKYAGPPSFAYTIGDWHIDRNGLIVTPEFETTELEPLRQVLEALKNAGAVAEGDGTVSISMAGHNGATLRNIVNLLWSKQILLQKALDRQKNIVSSDLVQAINAVPIDSIEDFVEAINEAGISEGTGDLIFDAATQTLKFGFSNASLNTDEAFAFIMLCWRINQQAKQQKFTSVKQKETENDKYAMRCWLLRLGFVGKAYKAERKVLLEKLTGNSAFRTEEALKAANEKRKINYTKAKEEERKC